MQKKFKEKWCPSFESEWKKICVNYYCFPKLQQHLKDIMNLIV